MNTNDANDANDASDLQNAFEENEEIEIKPTSDLFIGVLLSNPANEPILINLINAVLTDSGQVPVVAAQVLNPISLRDYSVEKQIVLDVRVRDERNVYYNIEVQTHPQPAFNDRVLFGWAKTYAGQAKRGELYSHLRPVCAIAITEFSIFPGLPELHLRFRIGEVRHPEVTLSGHFDAHVLRLHPLLKKELLKIRSVRATLAHWLTFLILGREKEGAMSDFGREAMREPVMREAFEQPVIKEAKRQFDAFCADPVARDLERRRREFEFFQRYEVTYAREEGYTAGKTEGIAETTLELARRMKTHGDDVAYIADITGLSAADIEKL